MIEIKQLTTALLKQYHDSLMSSYDALVPSSHATKETIVESFGNMLGQGSMIFVAVDTVLNQVVGTATVFIEHKIIRGGVKAGHVEDVAVSQQAQGQGVGTKLMNACIKFCEEQGCYKTILDCDSENATYYERFGFENKGAFMRKYN